MADRMGVKIIALMVARVEKASAAALEYRRREYLRKHTICNKLRSSEERRLLAEHVKAKKEGMEHPIFEVYTLIPTRWKKPPESKLQANEWAAAVRRGVLPLGAYIVARPGSDLLATGAMVGILFLE